MMNTICVLFTVILIESNLYSTVGHSQLEKLRYFPKVKLLQPKGFSVTIEGLDKIKHVNLYEEGNTGQRLRRSVNSNASNLLEERFGLLDPKHVYNRYPRQYVRIKDIDNSYIEKSVLFRGRLQTSRTRGKQCFLVLRQQEDTMQCFLHVAASTSKIMLSFASKITRESIIDVVGRVQKTSMEIKSCSIKWFEIFVQELWVVSKAEILPIQVVDCARPEIEYKGTNVVGVAKPDSLNITVNQDKKLDHRVLDLRTPANQAIFRIESAVCQMFRNILIEQGFMEIHTPKIINAASEGGANVFEVSYFKGSAYLAQSPQLYKQMAIAADFEKVFTIGAVFRAEESHTSRHLTEFVGLDLEMAIKQNYSEVLDVIESTFIKIFKMLDDKYTKEILTIREQYHSEPFQFTEPSPRIKYSEGLQMLKDAGVSLHYESDFSSQHERLLGKLVKERYKTDFFILDKYPISARPFYTMADLNNPNLSNSYDIFMRGEEVMSGAQRIHDAEVLKKSALRHNVDLNKIKPYIDAFRYGCSPHAGGGIGLERTVALFLGLENVRKTSLFPRDPNRLTP